jgi:putative transposase
MARAAAYRQLLHEALSDDDPKAIRIYRQRQRALGRDDFRAMAKPRPNASLASGPRIARLTPIQTIVSEPGPVFAHALIDV